MRQGREKNRECNIQMLVLGAGIVSNTHQNIKIRRKGQWVQQLSVSEATPVEIEQRQLERWAWGLERQGNPVAGFGSQSCSWGRGAMWMTEEGVWQEKRGVEGKGKAEAGSTAPWKKNIRVSVLWWVGENEDWRLELSGFVDLVVCCLLRDETQWGRGAERQISRRCGVKSSENVMTEIKRKPQQVYQ